MAVWIRVVALETERQEWTGGVCSGRNDWPCCVSWLSRIVYLPGSLNDLVVSKGSVPSAWVVVSPWQVLHEGWASAHRAAVCCGGGKGHNEVSKSTF